MALPLPFRVKLLLLTVLAISQTHVDGGRSWCNSKLYYRTCEFLPKEYRFHSQKGKCIAFYPEKKTWDESRLACRKDGTRLLQILEWRTVLDARDVPDDAWLGLSWTSNHTPFWTWNLERRWNVFRMHPMEAYMPDTETVNMFAYGHNYFHASGKCSFVNMHGAWEVADCDTKLGYFCEANSGVKMPEPAISVEFDEEPNYLLAGTKLRATCTGFVSPSHKGLVWSAFLDERSPPMLLAANLSTTRTWPKHDGLRCAPWAISQLEMEITEATSRTILQCCTEASKRHGFKSCTLGPKLALYDAPDIPEMEAQVHEEPNGVYSGGQLNAWCTSYLGEGKVALVLQVVMDNDWGVWSINKSLVLQTERPLHNVRVAPLLEHLYSDGVGAVVRLNLRIVVSAALNGGFIKCSSQTAHKHNTTETYVGPFKVLFLPYSPSLEVRYHKEPDVVFQGDILEATCNAMTGSMEELIWKLTFPRDSVNSDRMWRLHQPFEDMDSCISITFSEFATHDDGPVMMSTFRAQMTEAFDGAILTCSSHDMEAKDLSSLKIYNAPTKVATDSKPLQVLKPHHKNWVYVTTDTSTSGAYVKRPYKVLCSMAMGDTALLYVPADMGRSWDKSCHSDRCDYRWQLTKNYSALLDHLSVPGDPIGIPLSDTWPFGEGTLYRVCVSTARNAKTINCPPNNILNHFQDYEEALNVTTMLDIIPVTVVYLPDIPNLDMKYHAMPSIVGKGHPLVATCTGRVGTRSAMIWQLVTVEKTFTWTVNVSTYRSIGEQDLCLTITSRREETVLDGPVVTSNLTVIGDSFLHGAQLECITYNRSLYPDLDFIMDTDRLSVKSRRILVQYLPQMPSLHLVYNVDVPENATEVSVSCKGYVGEGGAMMMNLMTSEWDLAWTLGMLNASIMPLTPMRNGFPQENNPLADSVYVTRARRRYDEKYGPYILGRVVVKRVAPLEKAVISCGALARLQLTTENVKMSKLVAEQKLWKSSGWRSDKVTLQDARHEYDKAERHVIFLSTVVGAWLIYKLVVDVYETRFQEKKDEEELVPRESHRYTLGHGRFTSVMYPGEGRRLPVSSR